MKNTFGCTLTVTVFGESHGEAIGAVIDGIAPGIEIDTAYINKKLDMRRPRGTISTSRVEADGYSIVSGVFEGYTTGTPITVIIPNENKKSEDYLNLAKCPRPSHADYTAGIKYHGFQDYRGGGHFSGRITAATVAAGAIIQKALEDKGIYIGTHIKYLDGISDREFSDYQSDINALDCVCFPVLDEKAGSMMTERIEAARMDLDSVGGILETAVIGMPAGVGEPWFDSIESQLAHAMFSIPAVKGVEFGAGFGIVNMRGSEANDPFVTDGKAVTTKTNNNGGINGGISNGMPIIMRCAIKPPPSIYKEQDTVDLSAMKNEKLEIKGRHDPAIIHRARVVADAMTAIALADLLTVRYGTDYLASSQK